MKENFTKFICDNKECKKEIIVEGDKIGKAIYPYSDGWKYLYSIQYKTVSYEEIKKIDKHFCSSECFITYISRSKNLVFKKKKEGKK